ncbi:MAG: S41 family peptidase, partial [Proteocatella sp.]
NMDNVFDAINIIGKDDRKYIVFGDYQTVDMEVLRNEERLKFTVDREKIKDKAFSYEIMDNVGYIKIERFIYGTSGYLKEALEEMNSKNIDKVIIDLRDNPGGLLESVVDVSGYLVGKQKILYTENKSGEKKDYVSPNAKLYDGKLCLLVNENSASASEAMSAAMKDYARAQIIGVNTFGKGIVQTTYSRIDGSGYKLTTNEYFSPNGGKIHTLGVAPDVEVKETEKQLKKAIELLEKED